MKIAILGAGRIGAALARSFMAYPSANIQLALIIDTFQPQAIADRILYDSWHGKLAANWSFIADAHHFASMHQQQTVATRQRQAENCLELLREFNIDCVVDCTGRQMTKQVISNSLIAGDNRKVLLSQPDQNNTDFMYIVGMQHSHANTQQKLLMKIQQAAIISAASCTSIALAPLAQIIDTLYSITSLRSLTLHSAMNDQKLLDASDSLAGSSGILNLIPTPTRLNLGIEKILPNLSGKVSSQAIRIPIVPTCAMDVVFQLKQKVNSLQDLDILFNALHNFGNQFTSISAGSNAPLIHLTEQALTSMKILGIESFCCISKQDIEITDHSLRLLLWFDNETGFAHHLKLSCELINLAG